MFPPEIPINTDCLQGTAVDTPDLRDLLEGSNFLSAWQNRRSIKEDPQRCVVLLRGETGRPYLLKCFWPSRAKRLRRLITGRDSLSQSHQALKWLSAHDIAVPQSLAVLRWRQTSGQPQVWCHLQEYLAGAITLHAALTESWAADPAGQARLIEKTIVQLGHLHQLKRYHGDMKLTNIMVRGDQVYLVDVEGRGSLRFRRHQQKDLARFFVGLAEAHISAQQIRDAMHRYQQLMGTVDGDFVEGVRSAVSKIARRHERDRGLSLVDKLNIL